LQSRIWLNRNHLITTHQIVSLKNAALLLNPQATHINHHLLITGLKPGATNRSLLYEVEYSTYKKN